MDKFILTNREVTALYNNLDRLFGAYSRGKYPFNELTESEIPIVHQEMHILFQVRDDIELYLDALEAEAQMEMMEEENA